MECQFLLEEGIGIVWRIYEMEDVKSFNNAVGMFYSSLI